jgi:cytidine deaminase
VGAELVARADSAAARAYAPYSNYLVGAAVRLENAAYPLGVCAEKSAIVAAVTAGYRPGDFESIGITASPCGGCRQWLHEFRFDEVRYRRGDGSIAAATPAELLPDTWNLPEPA